MDDVETIAKGLTKAQYKVVVDAFRCHALGWGEYWQARPGGSTVALCKKGLIREKVTRTLTGRDKRCYELSPLGLRVREYLQEQSQ